MLSYVIGRVAARPPSWLPLTEAQRGELQRVGEVVKGGHEIAQVVARCAHHSQHTNARDKGLQVGVGPKAGKGAFTPARVALVRGAGGVQAGAGAEDPASFSALLADVVGRLSALAPGQAALVPGGWRGTLSVGFVMHLVEVNLAHTHTLVLFF